MPVDHPHPLSPRSRGLSHNHAHDNSKQELGSSGKSRVATKEREKTDREREMDSFRNQSLLEIKCSVLLDGIKSLEWAGQEKSNVMSEELRHLLNIPSNKRTFLDLRKLRGALRTMGLLYLFPDITSETEMDFCRYVKREFFPFTGASVFRAGEDSASGVYVIVRGGVKIWTRDIAKNQQTILDEKFSGTLFGEQAVITGEPRNANVTIINEKTELLRLGRDDFLRITQPSLERQRMLKLGMLAQVFPFCDWPTEYREDLAQKSTLRTYNAGKHIIKEGDHANEAYIVTKGTCTLYQTIPVPKELLEPKVLKAEFNIRTGESGNKIPVDFIAAPPLQDRREQSTPFLTETGDMRTRRREGIFLPRVASMSNRKGLLSLPLGRSGSLTTRSFRHKPHRHRKHTKEKLDLRGAKSNRRVAVVDQLEAMQSIPTLNQLRRQQRRQKEAADTAKAKAAEASGAKPPTDPPPAGRRRHRSRSARESELHFEEMPVKIEELWRGSVFGEWDIIQGTTRTSSAIADTLCEVVVIPKKALLQLFSGSKDHELRQRAFEALKLLGEKRHFSKPGHLKMLKEMDEQVNWDQYKSIISQYVIDHKPETHR